VVSERTWVPAERSCVRWFVAIRREKETREWILRL
jgi:hypothetical protein